MARLGVWQGIRSASFRSIILVILLFSPLILLPSSRTGLDFRSGTLLNVRTNLCRIRTSIIPLTPRPCGCLFRSPVWARIPLNSPIWG